MRLNSWFTREPTQSLCKQPAKAEEGRLGTLGLLGFLEVKCLFCSH